MWNSRPRLFFKKHGAQCAPYTSWTSRIQMREYILRATGWPRSVAGLQSLLSVYLPALWVLTYFGCPFD
ncbi:MAG: hypothetical protein A2139_08490 [Desulfobacca sp. RBG_16_60_12]|nr:MAG: hypothetical protein A2139_08490 [Desulfobacca sp. RBG_16_60_12]